MKTTKKTMRRAILLAAIGAVTMVGMTACMHMRGMLSGAERPAAEQFGFGPRASASGSYTATLQAAEPLRVRKMHTLTLVLTDANGRPIEGATIAVDGGMPQHGHGLPTRPRVTRAIGDGAYEVGGVKFNMGGWWELKFAVAGAMGSDTITFNLDL